MLRNWVPGSAAQKAHNPTLSGRWIITVTEDAANCPLDMNANKVTTADAHERLVLELADRLVRMRWFAPNSAGLQQMIEHNLSNASDDELTGLIEACDRHIADPPRCG